MIESKDYAGRTCVLVNTDTGQPVQLKQKLVSRGGDAWYLDGGRAPHKPESTGKVWVKTNLKEFSTSEFFPSVFNLNWKTQ